MTDSDEGQAYNPTLYLDLHGALSYREYFSSREDITGWRSFEVDAGLLFKLFPGRLFSVELFDDYVRSLPAWSGAPAAKDTNQGGLRLVLSPGLLNFVLGYSVNLDFFEDQSYAFARKYYHQVNLLAKWRLLPKSAVFFNAIWQAYSYFDQGSLTASNYTNYNSMPIRLYLGYSGLFTPKFGAMLRVGYGNSWYEVGGDYNMLIGGLELTYYIGPVAQVKFGFDHDFHDSFYSNYFVDEKIYLGYDHQIINRIIFHLEASYRYRWYEGFDPNARHVAGIEPVDPIRNHIFSADISLEYKIRDWIDIGVSYVFDMRDLASKPIPNGQVGGNYVNDFQKHQVFAKVEVAY